MRLTPGHETGFWFHFDVFSVFGTLDYLTEIRQIFIRELNQS